MQTSRGQVQAMTEFSRFLERNRHFDHLVARDGVRWLGQNTNHLEPHPAVLAAMQRCIDRREFQIYAPPLGLEELRAGILDDLGLVRGDFQVLVTDGAIEGLYHTCRTLLRPGDEMVVADPGWLWPRAFAAESGAEVVEIPVYTAEAGYRIVPQALEAVLTDKTRLIYLVDPNNPTGAVQTKGEISEIARIAHNAGVYVVHDCTYRDFADGHTLLASEYPERTITTYSFSKWLGLAGLRVGAVVACDAIAERLASAPPNNLGSSILAQRAAIAGLEIKRAWFPRVQAAQLENQRRVRAAAEAIDGYTFPVFPSNGNFLLMDVTGAGVAPAALCQWFLQHDMLIRQGSYHTHRFADRFVKISTTVPEDWIDAFCRLLSDATREAKMINESVQLY